MPVERVPAGLPGAAAAMARLPPWRRLLCCGGVGGGGDGGRSWLRSGAADFFGFFFPCSVVGGIRCGFHPSCERGVGSCVPGDALAVYAAAMASGVRLPFRSPMVSATADLASSSLCAVEGGFLRVSVLGLLSCLSVLLALYSASFGWAVVLRRMRGQIKEPTADGLSPNISCSLPMLDVRSLIWKGEVGGWSKRCAGRRTGERRWRLELRKKNI